MNNQIPSVMVNVGARYIAPAVTLLQSRRHVCRPYILLFFIVFCGLSLPINAQDTGVYVTTQDSSSLRSGASKSFDRIAVVPPATTLPAVGRTVRSDWIEVDYNGQLGWISATLLVWSGDILTLPVDGVETTPYIRRELVTAEFSTEAPIYANEIAANDEVGTLPGLTYVELIGRLGGPSNGLFWVQILYEGQQYWTGSWNLKLLTGDYLSLEDKSYLFAYGRLVLQIGSDIGTVSNRLATVENRWLALQSGDTALCDPIELAKTSQATERDVRAEPLFAPALTALDTGIDNVNSSIAAFTDACNSTDTYVTPSTIRAALEDTATARRNLNLSQSLVNAMDTGNPVLGN